MSKEEEKDDTSNVTFDLLRVTPEPPEKESFYKSDRLTDLLIILFIFGISVWFRFYARQVFIDAYGNAVFHLTIINGDPLGFGKFLGVEPGDTVYTEGYHDFFTYYIPYVNAYEEGWNPYTGSRAPDDNIGGYVYGPFYMISIAIGKVWFGMSTIDSIVFSNIILDALTWVMVYILAKRVTGNVIALVFALVGSFSPISLFFIAYRGLNAPIMNFIFLVFVWCYLEKRDNLSMFFLAFGILTKQFPLFMAMPAGFWMVRRYGFTKGVGYYLRFFISVLVLSVPYLLWTPRSYVIRLFLPGGSKSNPSCPSGGEATNLFHALIPVEACLDSQGRRTGLQLELLPEYYDIVFTLVNSHILFFLSLVILAWVGFMAYDYFEERPKLYLVFFAAYYGLAHATIARGVFKYYITFLVPLFVLGFVVGDRYKSAHLRLGFMLNQAWSNWINPKYRQREATIGYWLYTTLLIIGTGSVIWLIQAAVSLFTFNTDTTTLWNVILIPIALLTIIKPGPKPEKKETEEVDPTHYGLHITKYSILAIPGAYLLYKIAGLYFASQNSMTRNMAILIGIILIFFAIPVMERQITGNQKIYSPFTFNPTQLILDLIGIFIVYQLMIFFHIQVFTIHRHYTTLFLLLFSFIPMGLLGGEVWSSAWKVPAEVIKKYRQIRHYTNPRIN